MTAIIVTIAFLALVTYALQRNHARQGYPHVAGSDAAETTNPLQRGQTPLPGGVGG
ncbi:hypothetical protein [Amycolatopsis sp. NPDC051071]|uniref:hypothetical protein n=1 Tax=Amycolatopsis sp. NPDC051071 TaxID=3154637 RepID=UPI00343C8183